MVYRTQQSLNHPSLAFVTVTPSTTNICLPEIITSLISEEERNL